MTSASKTTSLTKLQACVSLHRAISSTVSPAWPSQLNAIGVLLITNLTRGKASVSSITTVKLTDVKPAEIL